MSTKHTPGPWTAVRCKHGWHIGPQPSGTCGIRDNTDGSKYEEHEANSNLIAAAPDMLEALEECVHILRTIPLLADGNLESMTEAACNMAQDVIAKAKKDA